MGVGEGDVMERARVMTRKVVRVGAFVGFTGVMIPLYVARDRVAARGGNEHRGRVRDRWLGRWSGTLLRLFGIRVTYRHVGRDAHPFASTSSDIALDGQAGGKFVVSNHRSAIDVGILLRHFGGHMVSRADLAGWPVVGAAARSVNTVFVDRASTVSGASTIRAIRALLQQGETILLFPEGTTFAGDEVRPFAPGAFIAPLKTAATIVPVGIAYASGADAAFVGESFPAHLARMAGGKTARVVVHIGDPIAVAAGSRAADLAKQSQGAVQRLVESARREVDG